MGLSRRLQARLGGEPRQHRRGAHHPEQPQRQRRRRVQPALDARRARPPGRARTGLRPAAAQPRVSKAREAVRPAQRDVLHQGAAMASCEPWWPSTPNPTPARSGHVPLRPLGGGGAAVGTAAALARTSARQPALVGPLLRGARGRVAGPRQRPRLRRGGVNHGPPAPRSALGGAAAGAGRVLLVRRAGGAVAAPGPAPSAGWPRAARLDSRGVGAERFRSERPLMLRRAGAWSGSGRRCCW